MSTTRYGMTVPFAGLPLGEQRDWFRELVDLGYTDVWSSEADGADAFTPLTLASVWAPELRLGTAIVPAYTRGPGCLAQTVGSVAQAAPGRFVLGVGSSSNVIVERWNDIPFEEPYKRTRDVVRFLRDALSGEKVRKEYETFSVSGFKLGVRPTEPVPILVAALREGMLRLAGREGDGAIVNWLSADDVATVAPIVKAFGEDKEVVARIFAAYLNVPVYAAFHEWLGRSEALTPMWDAWKAGDRAAALEAIPDEVVDQLIVHGSPEACREHLERYRANGVDTTAVALMPVPGALSQQEAYRALAPR